MQLYQNGTIQFAAPLQWPHKVVKRSLVHIMPAHFANGENVRQIGLPFTRKRHIFCRQILKNGTSNGMFENGIV